MVVSVASFVVVGDREEQRIRREFDRLAGERAISIQNAVVQELEALRSVEALYASSLSVEPDEFGTFAHSILSRRPGVRALGWVAHEHAGATRFPLRYLEPAATADAALELDLGARQAWLAELERAIAADAPTVTRRIEVANLTTPPSRFVGLLPIGSKRTSAGRRELHGFVLGVFDMARIVEDALRLFSHSPAGVDAAVYDDPSAAEDALVYRHSSGGADARSDMVSARAGRLRYVRTFEAGERRWAIVCTPTAAFIAERSTGQPWIVLAIGVLFTAAVAGFVWSLIRRAVQVEEVVHQRTGELRLVNRRLEGEIGERRRAEEDLRRAHDNLEVRVEQRTAELSGVVQELERANRLKSEFVSTMSHELRTPLNVILGFSHMARDETFSAREREEFHDRIESASRELLRMIESTLDIGKLESGRDEPRPETVVLPDFWVALERDCACLPRNAAVQLEWSRDVPMLVFTTDPHKLGAAMRNLVGNALKFTHEGSVRADVYRDGQEIVFRVEDTGIGIRAEDHEAIFEMFRQADGSDSRHYGGAGLGLYIVRRVVGQLGGRIEVASEVGRGSVFTIRFALPFVPLPKPRPTEAYRS